MLEQDLIILDVEGTISSLDYIIKNLTPLTQRKLPEFVYSFRENEIDQQVELIKAQIAEETDRTSEEVVLAEVTGKLLNNIEMGIKSDSLTYIQEKIWQGSLAKGTIKTHVYADVLPFMTEVASAGKKICIFCSYSKEFTKAYLQHSEHGDLTSHVHHWFDQEIGPKKKKASYEAILSATEESAENTLFISDNPLELNAAIKCGIKTFQMVRSGVLPVDDYDQLTSFSDLK